MPIDFTQFPHLQSDTFRYTSDPDANYNCIAFAAGDTNRFWDPAVEDGYYWPEDLATDYSIDTLVMLYEGEGYDLCLNGDFQAGIEKVVLYEKDGIYEHAARQIDSGFWTSKLGLEDDIVHPRPESVAGGLYGQVCHFLERKRTGPPPTPPRRSILIGQPKS